MSNYDDQDQRFWSLTVNFPDEYLDDEDAQRQYITDAAQIIRDLFEDGHIEYATGQLEVGRKNRLHLQAMCVTTEEHDRRWLYNRIPQAHIEGMKERSEPRFLRHYCRNRKKKGFVETFMELGVWPSDNYEVKEQTPNSRRSPYRELITMIMNGYITDFAGCVSYDAPTAYARKRDLMECLKDAHNERIQLESKAVESQIIKLRCWQHWLFRYLNEIPGNDRPILFMVDHRGGSGKSTFCKWYELFGVKKSAYYTVMKKADLAHITDTMETEVYFIDVTKEQTEYMDSVYSFAEELKNGRLGSGKFDGQIKRSRPNHVVIFMNHMPRIGGEDHPTRRVWNEVREKWEFEKRDAPLSADRYLIWKLSADCTYNQVWTPDHRDWGTACIPFRTYVYRGECTAMDEGPPYIPPLVEDHGPAFKSDNAGDGPSTQEDEVYMSEKERLWLRYLYTGRHPDLKRPTPGTRNVDVINNCDKCVTPLDFHSYNDYEWYLVNKWKNHKTDKGDSPFTDRYIHKLKMYECHEEIKLWGNHSY